MEKNPLLDKVAIVTGASSGIGRATALALVSEGARVALASRRAAELEEVASQSQAQGGEAMAVPTDVTQRNEVEQLVQKVLARWERVDILVANAGEYVRSPVTVLSVAELERSMAVNFYGSVYAALAVLPRMLAQGSGHLVFVTSADGKKGIPPDAPYVSAKFALSGFAEVLRQELHGTGVYATTVFPGRVDTPMVDTLRFPWISPKIPAHAVARAIVRGILRRSPEVIIPFRARLFIYANTLSPRLGDWIARLSHLDGWEMERDAGHRFATGGK
jgi:NADP-dependent 3-hydroxy acid dehydrogenase YdfG